MTVLYGEAGGAYVLDPAPIAHGGQSSIWLARDARDGRTLVVKVAHEPSGDAVRLAALRLAALAEDPRVGPHLVPVWDTGTWGDRPFAVLERLEATLELPPDDRDAVRTALLAAFTDLARAGVVHGDVKPSNLFAHHGAVLLGDLWSGGDEIPLSPGFSAPEIWAGDPPSLPADAYALGATLYALYRGHPPLCAAGPHARAPTSAELAGVPEPAFVRALLDPDPARRPRLDGAPRARAVRWSVLPLVPLFALGAPPSPACEVACDGLVWVPPGRFVQGDPDRTWAVDAIPHPVVLSRGVWFRTIEVSRAEYVALTGADPMRARSEQLPDGSLHPCATWEGHDLLRPELPMVCVTWREAVELANRASARDGLRPAYTLDGAGVRWDRSADGWRLPTEAEWEWAARAAWADQPWAGASDREGLCAYANFRDRGAPELWGNETACADGFPVLAPVGSLAPNALGLHDVLGNAGEWTWDWYADYPATKQVDPTGGTLGPARAIRGGGWNQIARPVTGRYAAEPAAFGMNMGIRLVRN